MSQQKKSEKLHLIDRSTFDKIHQQNTNNASGSTILRIRNSKYKKTHGKTASCDLLQFLKPKPPPKCSLSEKRRQLRRRVIDTPLRQVKKHGKTREGGRKKHYSRLKKIIMRYREQKRQQTQQESQLCEEVTEKLKVVALAHKTDEDRKANNVHSRRFRVYCDNCTTPQLAQLTEKLLRELDRFQRRAYGQNEIKARAHRRFVVGFREAQNYLHINKVKLIIMAPDCEECASEAGLDETIAGIKAQCQQHSIPYLFSLRRRQLAYALYKKVPVSCVAILDYDGAREMFSQLVEALQEARHAYSSLLKHNPTTEQIQNEVLRVQ